MARRAYLPAQSTVDLRNRLVDLPWIAKVAIEAPHRGASITPARFWITEQSGVERHLSFEQARRLTGPEPHRCLGITMRGKGARCGRFVRSSSRYCVDHR